MPLLGALFNCTARFESTVSRIIQPFKTNRDSKTRFSVLCNGCMFFRTWSRDSCFPCAWLSVFTCLVLGCVVSACLAALSSMLHVFSRATGHYGFIALGALSILDRRVYFYLSFFRKALRKLHLISIAAFPHLTHTPCPTQVLTMIQHFYVEIPAIVIRIYKHF